jgi:hypothetical protein
MSAKIKTVKIHFKSRPADSAYFAGSIEEVPEHLAEKYISSGHAVPLTPSLPNDFPGRDKLIKAGILTLAEIRSVDLSTIDGLTKAEITKIEKELAE